MNPFDFDLEASLYQPDDYIGFGKHADETWAQVKESDPGYLIWMAGASEDMPDRKKFINSLFTVQLSLMPDQQQAADAITEQLIHGGNRVFRLQGGAGCVDKDTEFLTKHGWKKISEYKSGDSVLQWSPNGDTEFVEPLGYVKTKCERLNRIKTTTIDMVVSDTHRLPYITSKGNHGVKHFYELTSKTEIPRFFNTPQRGGVKLSDDLIRVLIMQSADGYFEKKHGTLTFINVKKDRKKERVEKLLNAANISFTINKSQPGYLRFRYYCPEEIYTKDLSVLWACNNRQLGVIYSEVHHWDGHTGERKSGLITKTFFGTKGNIDFIQYVKSTVSRKYCSITKDKREYVNGNLYSVSQSNRDSSTLELKRNKSIISEYKTLDGYEYCFKTPSSFWLARRNGKIFPTGNSGKSYSVMEIAQRAKQAGYTISAMATSYVASQVMNESLNPIGVEATTIARALSLRPDNNGFQAKYEPSPETEESLNALLGGKTLLIVDEDSFCSDTVVALVFGKMNESWNEAKLLTVGDKKQLPSPEQDDLCDFCEILPAFELTVPKRFEVDSDLHKLEMLVGQDPFGLPKYLQELEGDQIQRHASFGELCKQMIADINNHPDETALMLFYRRDAVAAANRAIRKLAYGDNIPDIMNGERLRVMRTTFVPVRYDYEKGTWESIRFYSGTFIISNNPMVGRVTVDFDQPDLPKNRLAPVEVVGCYIITDDDGNDIPVVFSKTEHMADPETAGGRDFNIALEQVKQYCIDANNWQLYHYFRSKFVQVAYGYATTVHRSQGASVDRIYINPKDILQGGKVAAPLGYVAGTRAKKMIHFVVDEVQ